VADALRLQGAPAVEVENTLRQAEARMPAAREVLRVRAMLAVREGNLGGARKQFEELTRRARSEEVIEVRPEFRLALLDLAAGQLEAAGKRADAVLASQPMHGGAQALRARITSATQVVASDPMPPEEKPAPPQPPRPPERPAAKETPGDGKAPAATRREPPPAAGEESYDVLLARGNAMAEAGNCREARVSFRKALDARPNGVEALTGLGYCHLDIREYVLAHARFRAALGIAPRYQEALWGMAETYERQGNAERALEAYERYLDAHPSGPRSDIARRQIERLKQRLAPAQPPGAPTGSGSSGGGSSGSGGSGSGSSGSGGSGSGSSEPSRPPASGGGQEGSTPPEARPDPTAPRVEVPDKKEAPPETLPPGESRSTEIDPALPSGEADKPARRDAAGNTDDPALPREEPGADEPAEEPAADEPDAAGQTTL
jgi:tetratricopeptide (TPR) repeat protein